MRKWIIAIVIIGLLGYSSYEFFFKGSVGLKVGDTAPDFELQTLDGETVSLYDHRGEKVILNFWATWCPPCRTEMPDMQAFHEDTDATILAVNLTEMEKSKAEIKSFTNDYDVSFTVLLDEQTEVSELYQAYNLPTSYFINTKGEVHKIVVGAISYEAMVQTFDEMK